MTWLRRAEGEGGGGGISPRTRKGKNKIFTSVISRIPGKLSIRTNTHLAKSDTEVSSVRTVQWKESRFDSR